MIDVFERLAPAYGRVVRKYALDVWYDRADVNAFLKKADFFKRRYESELKKYFKKQNYAFSPKRIRELSDRWLADQIITSRKLNTLSNLKKGKLADDLSRLDEQTRTEVIELQERTKVKPEGRVISVVSFSDNLSARALQIGEDAAFDLGREINHAVVSDNSDTYLWCSQEDKEVRPTHRILNKKLFSYNDPPTTVDKAGHRHTGNPGTEWGCRCFEKAKKGKPLLGYIARAV